MKNTSIVTSIYVLLIMPRQLDKPNLVYVAWPNAEFAYPAFILLCDPQSPKETLIVNIITLVYLKA